MVVQRTYSAGEHIVYKCPVEAQSSTLVRNPESNKKIIETIGSRGYIKLYEDVPSGSWTEVKTISRIEHEWLLRKTAEVGQQLFGNQEVEKSRHDLGMVPAPSIKTYSDKQMQFVSASAAQIVRSGIDIITLHDAVYTNPEHIDEVGKIMRQVYQEEMGIIPKMNCSFFGEKTSNGCLPKRSAEGLIMGFKMSLRGVFFGTAH